MQMRDTAANTFALTRELEKIMVEKWGMEHKPHADYDTEFDN